MPSAVAKSQNTIAAYLQAIRPKTLSASVGPVCIGFAAAGWSAIVNLPIVVLATLCCALLLQISANLVNDHMDYANQVDQPDRLGPARMVSSGRLSVSEIRRAYIVTLSMAALIGGYLVVYGGLPILVIGVCSLIIAYLYTAGPIPLSYIGLGEVMAFMFFGPIAVWGSWFLITGQYAAYPFLIGVGPGAIAWLMMAINNLRDRQSDRSSGKKTLAVLLTERAARRIALLGLVVSVVAPVAVASYLDTPIIMLTSGSFIFFAHDWRRVLAGPIDTELNRSLAATGKYFVLYSITLSLTLLWV